MDTLPFRTVSQALQAAFEALNSLAENVPAHKRKGYEETVRRVARARVAIDTWVVNSSQGVQVSYGINWANVRKRYIDQLIAKCFYHHQWGTRVVAVMQTPLFEYLREHMQFDEITPGTGAVDVAFLLYDYVETPEKHTLVFDRVVGTSHNSLMMSTLYQQTPPKRAFTDRILERLE